MTTGLLRYYGTRNLHFITCSCYHRQPHLGSPSRCNLFLQLLEEARRKYRFVIHGYVLMPEHFHLLITEPEMGDPSLVMKVIKQRFTRQAKGDTTPHSIWQKRFYDFNVWTEHKRLEKLRYIHRNPVERGLVEQPEQWKWSSFRAYFYGEPGPVRVNFQDWSLEIKSRAVENFGDGRGLSHPLIRKRRK